MDLESAGIGALVAVVVSLLAFVGLTLRSKVRKAAPPPAPPKTTGEDVLDAATDRIVERADEARAEVDAAAATDTDNDPDTDPTSRAADLWNRRHGR